MTATVHCRQFTPRVGAPEENRRRCTAAVRRAAAEGADIVLLPELATSGYVFASRAEAAAAALPADHPVFGEWAAAAGRATVVGGFCEQGAGGRLYNSAAVVDAGGLRTVYRKTHLWDTEKRFFTPGGELPPVLDTPVGRIGVLICYDLEFPEMTRYLALSGAQLIAAPVNWPAGPRIDGRPPEVVIAMAAARVNRVAIACCDRSGPERGVAWMEGSAVIAETGEVLAAAEDAPADRDGARTVRAERDLARALDKRLAPHADALADRRPELYRQALGDR